MCRSALPIRLSMTCRSRSSSPSTITGSAAAIVIGRPGSMTRARWTASAARLARSVGRRSSGRPVSKRASSRRSATSRLIRSASPVIRLISRSSSSRLAASPCCMPYSASPRTEVSGVRSSWLASATKRRIRSSDRSARPSPSARARYAVSMLASITSRASASRPTSVFPAGWSMRRDRSPPAIASASASIRASGARLARMSGRPMPASRMMATAPASASASSRRITVLFRSPRL